ncbi:MAG: polyprenyl synthetase family protein [Blastochloris sp.]|nr:polyprenyl synthetase family protein [Blastochloris sp.]
MQCNVAPRALTNKHPSFTCLPEPRLLFITIHVNLTQYWQQRQATFEKALNQALPKKTVRPATIHEAMRYSLFAGGKRLRPILCLAAAESLGGPLKNALPLACAVECIHTYSLIHDDLPSMDNDDLRRGKPTSHKVYGEGMAILAGDALLTIAFELVARCPGWPRYKVADLITELSRASGSQGLIAGQVVDLESEGKPISIQDLRYIHRNKTSALITSSLRLGAMSANATPTQLKTLTQFGEALGLAFQVMDDILDITQTSAELGKSAGKDVKVQKATYPALLGLEGAQKEAKRLTTQAMNALKPLGSSGQRLHEIAQYMLTRKN